MKIGLLVFFLILAFAASGALIVWKDSKRKLPGNLPKPLKDDDELER